MFTIEVKKRGKDEEFGFKDIRDTASIFHENCWDIKGVRGTTIWENESGQPCWIFTCKRCEKNTFIYYGNMDETKAKLVQTAIDGKERKILREFRAIQKI